MNDIDQHCIADTEPDLGGIGIACYFAVSTVLAGSTFSCYSEYSGQIGFNITMFSDECIPPVNSTIVVSNSSVTFECNDGLVYISPESSKPLCELQLHTDSKTNLSYLSSRWNPILTTGCITNICELPECVPFI